MTLLRKNDVDLRIFRAILDAENTSGRRPVYVHVASDVYAELWECVFDQRTFVSGSGATVNGVPVRESLRLAPGAIVPILPLP